LRFGLRTESLPDCIDQRALLRRRSAAERCDAIQDFQQRVDLISSELLVVTAILKS
jgi:hypothetical protein